MVENTMESAIEALGVYLAVKNDNNLEIPKPSQISALRADDGFITYVSVDASRHYSKNKAVKKTLTIPAWLNEEAEKRHINFSGVLQKALVEQLEIAK